MPIHASVGKSHTTPVDSYEGVRDALQNVLCETVEIREMRGLAGPNDVLQILMGHGEWVAFGIGCAIGKGFFEGLGKEAAASVWKSKSQFIEAFRRHANAAFTSLVQAIQSARQHVHLEYGQRSMTTITLSLYYPWPDVRPDSRNIGVEIDSDDPEEIAWRLVVFSQLAPTIRAIIDAMGSLADHPACEGRNASLIDRGDWKLIAQISWYGDRGVQIRWSQPLPHKLVPMGGILITQIVELRD